MLHTASRIRKPSCSSSKIAWRKRIANGRNPIHKEIFRASRNRHTAAHFVLSEEKNRIFLRKDLAFPEERLIVTIRKQANKLRIKIA